MSGERDNAAAIAVLEERMKTMQAEYKTDIARLAEDMAKRETALSWRFIGAIGIFAAITIGAIGLMFAAAGMFGG